MTHFHLKSLRKCADELGVSHAYLSKLKKEGRFGEHPVPGRTRGGYDIEEIRAAMPNRSEDVDYENHDESVDLFDDSMKPESSVADLSDEEREARVRMLAEAEEARKYVKENAAGVSIGDDDEEIDSLELIEARKRKEYWLARQAELKYKKEHGQLVDKDEVEREAFAVARLLRDKLMNIGDRLSPMLAAQNDRFVCKQMIDSEITQVLNGVIGGDS